MLLIFATYSFVVSVLSAISLFDSCDPIREIIDAFFEE